MMTHDDATAQKIIERKRLSTSKLFGLVAGVTVLINLNSFVVFTECTRQATRKDDADELN